MRICPLMDKISAISNFDICGLSLSTPTFFKRTISKFVQMLQTYWKCAFTAFPNLELFLIIMGTLSQ